MFGIAEYSDIGGRTCNEDTVLIRTLENQEEVLLILADGLGGHGGGDIASQYAAKKIAEYWNFNDASDGLENGFHAAHEGILKKQTAQCKMKSTGAAVSLHDTKITYAYVGDSRIYHFVNGKLVFQTRDHSASQIAVMLGDITPDEIRFHPDRSRLFRALGQEGELKVDTGSALLEPGLHAFLLCSDGFWEYIKENEMEEMLRVSVSAEEWLDSMKKLHDQRVVDDHDNNSAAVLWVSI